MLSLARPFLDSLFRSSHFYHFSLHTFTLFSHYVYGLYTSLIAFALFAMYDPHKMYYIDHSHTFMPLDYDTV